MDHGNICILTAYSARGSLEDVLLNEDLHLDNMFLASLVADLLKVSSKYKEICIKTLYYCTYSNDLS